MTRRELLERREQRLLDLHRECSESRDTDGADIALEDLALVQYVLCWAVNLDQPPETEPTP